MIAYKRSLTGFVFAAALVVTCTGRCQTPSSSPGSLRREIATALASAFPTTAGERQVQARRFLSLYAAADELPAAERTRLKLRLKSRLARLASRLRRDSCKQHTASASQTASASATQTTGTPAPKTAGLAGGGAQDEGQSLVDLIEATIAPETWDVNGGPGTIKYWPAWQVLVVRQTDEVHEQLGGVVRGMRK